MKTYEEFICQIEQLVFENCPPGTSRVEMRLIAEDCVSRIRNGLIDGIRGDRITEYYQRTAISPVLKSS